ncbi:MAG: hypothetical protein R3B36_15675 [Polyangiaceae bacterium]
MTSATPIGGERRELRAVRSTFCATPGEPDRQVRMSRDVPGIRLGARANHNCRSPYAMNTSNSVNNVRDFHRCTRGANLVEYIILVGVVAILCIGGFKFFGTSVTAKVRNQGGAVTGLNDQAGN